MDAHRKMCFAHMFILQTNETGKNTLVFLENKSWKISRNTLQFFKHDDAYRYKLLGKKRKKKRESWRDLLTLKCEFGERTWQSAELMFYVTPAGQTEVVAYTVQVELGNTYVIWSTLSTLEA